MSYLVRLCGLNILIQDKNATNFTSQEMQVGL